MKKLVSLLLCCLLLFSTVAMAETDWEQNIPTTPYDETITLTILGTDPVNGNSEISYDKDDPRRVGPNDNVWIDGYKKYLNIDVERIIADDSDSLGALVNTMLASNDLPDVMLVDRALFNTLIENEAILDMSELWVSYAPTAGQALLDTLTEEALDYGRVNGCLYGLPLGMNFYSSSKVLWIRQDWLDKVGMTAPTTWDELCQVAQAFIDNKLGGEYTIGIGFDGLNDGPLAAFDAAKGVWKEQADGTYAYDNTSENMKAALLGLQKLYADGLMNKDFAVSGGIGEEVANGHCGILYGEGWVGATDVNNSYVNDNSAEWIAVPVPTLTGERVTQWTNATVNDYCVINANCEHPEALLKVLDLELYLSYGATKEATDIYYSYSTAEGTTVAVWNLRALRNIIYSNRFDLMVSEAIDEALAEGATLEDTKSLPAYAVAWFTNGEPAHYADEAKKLEMKQGGSWGFANGVLKYGYPVILELAEDGYLRSEYPGTWTETMNTYWKSLDEALNAAALEVIMGKDISVYEEAIDSWYAGGGQTITDEVTAYYQSLK